MSQGHSGFLAVFLISATLGIAWGGAGAGRRGAAQEPLPRGASVAYRKDERFQKRVVLLAPPRAPEGTTSRATVFVDAPDPLARFEEPEDLDAIRPVGCEVFKASELLDYLAGEAGVDLYLQTAWRRVWVTIPRRDDTVAGRMDALARAFRGAWFPLGKDRWALAEDAEIARMATMSEADFTPLSIYWGRRLVHAITERQWAHLRAGGRIPFAAMSPSLRVAVLAKLRFNRYGPYQMEEEPTQQAMRGEGVYLELTPGFPGPGRRPDLDIVVPVQQDFASKKPRVSLTTGLYHPTTGKPLWDLPALH